MESTPTVEINVTDIADAVKCIDHASEQGAYKGWRLIREVITLRDKLDTFVEQTTQALEAYSESEQSSPQPPTDTHLAG